MAPETMTESDTWLGQRPALDAQQAEPEGAEGFVQMGPARLLAAYTHVNPTES